MPPIFEECSLSLQVNINRIDGALWVILILSSISASIVDYGNCSKYFLFRYILPLPGCHVPGARGIPP
jgi:hypothetical protein